MEVRSDKLQSPSIEGLNINQYKIQEFFCAYDRKKDLERRLKYLSIGLKLYLACGLSHDQFIEYHKERRLRIKRNLYIFRILMLVIGLYFMYEAKFWTQVSFHHVLNSYFIAGLVAWFIPFVAKVYSKNIRNNLIHTATALANDQCRNWLLAASLDDNSTFRHIKNRILEKNFENYEVRAEFDISNHLSLANTVSNQGSGISVYDEMSETTGKSEMSEITVNNEIPEKTIDTEIYSLAAFQEDLLHLSKQKNQFNGFSMVEVIDFFSVMCCAACEEDIPQMKMEDFISFLKMGFLGNPVQQKIRLDRFEVGITQEIFHQFMLKAGDELFENKSGASIKYLQLLTDHFEGFEFKKVKNNFRTITNKRLTGIRNEYKSEIQNVHMLQK